MEKLRSRLYRLIRHSEFYAKTDLVYVFKNSFWLNLGQAAGAIIALLLSVVFANLVAPETYGIYKYILSVSGIISAITLTGMGTAVIQGIAAGQAGILRAAIKKSLRWSIVPAAAALILAGYYALNQNFILAIGLIIIGLTVPLTNAFGLYSSFLNGKKDFRSSTFYWFFTYAGTSAFLIGIILLTEQVLWLIGGYFLANLFFNWFFYRLNIGPVCDEETTDNEKLLTYGQHLSVMGFIGTLAHQLDKILIFQLLGSAPLAVYSFAFAIPEQIKGSFKNLFNIALPKYSTHDKIALRRSIKEKILRLTLAAIFLAAGYIVTAPIIFKFLFPKYLASVFYSQIYILGIIAIPGLSLCNIYFQVQKSARILYQITIASNLVTVVLTIGLIYWFGVLGAVIENGLSWFFILALNLYFFAKDK